jgi:protein-disulfide isomerase/uncharacterized membrane protein/rhodanese-related sulfurtransferase
MYLLLAIGLLLASKLLHIDYMVNYTNEPYKSFCNVNDTFNCDAVAASEYAHIFGVPIALIGTIANIILLIFLPIGMKLLNIKKIIRQVYLLIFTFYCAGSIALATVSLLVLKSYCFLCMGYWLTAIITFVYLKIITKDDCDNLFQAIKNVVSGAMKHKLAVGTHFVLFFAINIILTLTTFSADCLVTIDDQCHNYDPVTKTAYLGTDQSKVDIKVFTDFQCPFCSRAHKMILDLEKKYDHKVKFIRKDFPLDMECNSLITRPFHKYACKAAYFTKCAGEQGVYWEVHDEIYNMQKKLNDEVLDNIAKLHVKDWNKFQTCTKSEWVRSSIKKDVSEGLFLGISGTPAYLVFGELFVGVLKESDINDYVKTYPRIKMEVLKRIYDKRNSGNIQIIDLRPRNIYETDHFRNAVNIPINKINTTSDLIKTKPILLYADDSKITDTAFQTLTKRGFKNMLILSNTIKEWLDVYNNMYVDN